MTAADDQILDAPHNMDLAARIDLAKVARAQPPSLVEGALHLFLDEVAGEDLRPASD